MEDPFTQYCERPREVVYCNKGYFASVDKLNKLKQKFFRIAAPLLPDHSENGQRQNAKGSCKDRMKLRLRNHK